MKIMESKVYMYFCLKKSDEIITCYENIPPSHSHITWAEVSSSAAQLRIMESLSAPLSKDVFARCYVW